MFYRWQEQLFENGSAAFNGQQVRSEERKLRQKIDTLEQEVSRKNEVIAEISQEYVQVKKGLGGLRRPHRELAGPATVSSIVSRALSRAGILLGHHLPAEPCAGSVLLSLPVLGCLEPQDPRREGLRVRGQVLSRLASCTNAALTRRSPAGIAPGSRPPSRSQRPSSLPGPVVLQAEDRLPWPRERDRECQHREGR